MKITIGHLYPNLMNLYGDTGNILCLVKRCQWRGIKVEVEEISLKNRVGPKKCDLFFAGGGQDRQQIAVSRDLQGDKKKILKEAAEKEVPILVICGSYQLFGHFFQPFEGPRLQGIGLFDAQTIASKKRKIGNVVIETSPFLFPNHRCQILAGFENHSGNTYLGGRSKPLGKVLVGFGNNGEDQTEGAVYKNVFGSYLHGSLLPKNPHFADQLIKLALKRNHGEVELKPLDDSLEWQAHRTAINRARQAR